MQRWCSKGGRLDPRFNSCRCFFFYISKSISIESAEGRNPIIQEVYERDFQLGGKSDARGEA